MAVFIAPTIRSPFLTWHRTMRKREAASPGRGCAAGSPPSRCLHRPSVHLRCRHWPGAPVGLGISVFQHDPRTAKRNRLLAAAYHYSSGDSEKASQSQAAYGAPSVLHRGRDVLMKESGMQLAAVKRRRQGSDRAATRPARHKPSKEARSPKQAHSETSAERK